jgi:Mg-chelatase subunit ChlD
MSVKPTHLPESPISSADWASTRLQSLMKPRETIYPLFRETVDVLGRRFGGDTLEAWSSGVLKLLNVNAGAASLINFWVVSREQFQDQGLQTLIVAVDNASEICRLAGARAAASVIGAHPAARLHLKTDEAVLCWWKCMSGFARAAPECVELVALTVSLLLSNGIQVFEDFLAAGLKLSGNDRSARRAFFAVETAFARRFLERAGHFPLFGNLERELGLYLTALWGIPPALRVLTASDVRPPPHRANIAAPLLRLPEYFPGVRGPQAHRLFIASAAHASAHLALGGPAFRVGSLRPLQVAMVNVVEDARIEVLAMQRLPGLRDLWAPYHVASADAGGTAPSLMARLSRALFDPSFRDDHGIVAKGRSLFEAAFPRINEPAISREIGSLLGNDLGQMRIQFNPKGYMVEPVYRDDGLGLWDLNDDEEAAEEILELAVEAARLERREEDGGRAREDIEPDRENIGSTRLVAPEEVGFVLATYPEWDRAAGIERPDWTTVREIPSLPGDTVNLDAALDAAGLLRSRIARLVKGARIGRARRLRRLQDGQDLDLDALTDAGIALRAGVSPDPRVFTASEVRARDLATVVLIDVSESTRDPTASGKGIIDAERLAVAALAEAMTALGDPFAILAFASNGRDEVRITPVKSIAEPYDQAATSRLAALQSGFSTRLGAALRHAGRVLEAEPSYRKLVIVLTDGEPSDTDVADPLDLIEDARRAVSRIRQKGIDSFGVIIGPSGGLAPTIFGRGNAILVKRIEDLPAKLSNIYFRMARR